MKAQTTRAPVLTPKKRCAIYTRKSTDEGLDQEYNSLEAQRDSALAFISSKRHEGWIAIDDGYDDGGFSGGNTNRPLRQRLLADVEDGRIDVVVVYKIDRLSRSLCDFAKIVDLFEERGVPYLEKRQSAGATYDPTRPNIGPLPALEIETAVLAQVHKALQEPEMVVVGYGRPGWRCGSDSRWTSRPCWWPCAR